MKFVYEYRTSDNVPHRGTIAASSKEAAYDTLKAQGIKPGKVWEAPGVFNKLFGKGKRWIAIVVLLVALAGVTATLISVKRNTDVVVRELEDASLYEDRGQIYGPKAVLMDLEANEYAAVFSNALERFLAPYAIPAKVIGSRRISLPQDLTREQIAKPVSVEESDHDEVKKLKRMVNGVKREFAEYLGDGGNTAGYLKRLEIRQKAEADIYERTKAALLREQDASVWREKNANLRAKGLPMVDPPSADF